VVRGSSVIGWGRLGSGWPVVGAGGRCGMPFPLQFVGEVAQVGGVGGLVEQFFDDREEVVERADRGSVVAVERGHGPPGRGEQQGRFDERRRDPALDKGLREAAIGRSDLAQRARSAAIGFEDPIDVALAIGGCRAAGWAWGRRFGEERRSRVPCFAAGGRVRGPILGCRGGRHGAPARRGWSQVLTGAGWAVAGSRGLSRLR